MKYARHEYLAPGVKTTDYKMMFGSGSIKVPVPDRPISIRENFKRAYKHQNPIWVPNSMTDITSEMIANLTGAGEADWSRKDRYDWQDWFGVDWTFVPEAGGPMLKVGTQYLDDIVNWETGVKFPNLDDYDIETRCKKFMETFDKEKILHVNIGLGCTERLVALMGGYTEAMIALAMEPEAVRDFLFAFVDFEIKVVDKLCQYLPIDMITYHDDWGTERDTFFGEKMMEDIVFDPTKKLFDHIKSKDICIELHSCGHIERFVPYMIKLGVDFLQIQARANDIPAFKKKWGDKIGFDLYAVPEGNTKEDVIKAVHDYVDTYAAGGGLFGSVMTHDPELVWTGIMELYCYSREKYDAERGL
ncbi:MAG: hypothetical protein GX111_09535 [Clostridiales bacterium]|nr:hypothetical protein [Clostridiales bacterium]